MEIDAVQSILGRVRIPGDPFPHFIPSKSSKFYQVQPNSLLNVLLRPKQLIKDNVVSTKPNNPQCDTQKEQSQPAHSLEPCGGGIIIGFATLLQLYREQ
jgi:hypothetical protein